MADGPPRDALQLRLLGELQISRGASGPMPLPPSKKTRALLAFLVLSGRAHRREALCSMFWDVADDPRGALRWSLSKLRGLLDDPEHTRVIADRERVAIELCGAQVDVLQLRAELATPSALADASSERLEQLAASFAGELLEGLDLADFDEYQAFCVAEREHTRKLRAALLEELCKRCSAEPERALLHARAWAQCDPLRFEAREAILRHALAAGRREEAAQHYASARRTFEELGSPSALELTRLWGALRTRSGRPAAEANVPAAEPAAEARTAPERPSRSAPLPLVGRERELSWLTSALARVAAERSERVLLLCGEPGIGKTRLLEALIAEARRVNATVLLGSAYEGEAGRPYGPLIDGLRALRLESGQSEQLLPELGAARAADESRDRLFAAISDFIAVRAHSAPPVLIALDDAQWLDSASAELLHYLARQSRHRPLLVVLALRSEESSDNAALGHVLRGLRRDRLLDEQTLAPLAKREIRALVAQLLGGDPEHVIAQSGGNPLFALELARNEAPPRSAGAGPLDAPPRSAGAGPLDERSERLPSSISAAVRERLERLGADASDALRWAAVLGGSFPVSSLAQVMTLELEPLVSALEALELRSLLVRANGSGSEDYRFAHEVVRRVVYADLSEPRRRLMHRRVAHALREHGELSEARVAELAHHATLARDHDLAATACAAAARRCQRLFAHDEAVKLARRGLRHAEQLDGLERVKRTIELLEVELACVQGGDLAAQQQRLRALGDHALAEGATAHARRAYYMLSVLNWERGAWSEARRGILEAELLSRGGDDTQQMLSLADAARCLLLLERDLPEAGAMLAEAEARAGRLVLEAAELCDGRGILLLHQGKLDEAAAQFERAERLAAADRNLLLEFHALEHRAMLELDRERCEPAHALAQRMIVLADKLREGSELPFARGLCALARIGGGERHAQAELELQLTALRTVDAKYRLAYALTRAALLDVAQDHCERALLRAREARPIAELLERPSEIWLALMIAQRAAHALGEREIEDDAKLALAQGHWPALAALAKQRGGALFVREARALEDES